MQGLLPLDCPFGSVGLSSSGIAVFPLPLGERVRVRGRRRKNEKV
jgi:hypothetical protein